MTGWNVITDAFMRADQPGGHAGLRGDEGYPFFDFGKSHPSWGGPR